VFKAIPGQMAQIGVDIVDGLWSGLKSKWGSVTGWLGGAASSIGGIFRKETETHSPSQVMHEIGVDIMQGLANGMESMQGAVTNIAESIASGLTNALMGAIDGSKKLGDSLKDLLKQVTSMMLNNAFKMLFGGLFGGAGGGIGGLIGKIFGGFRAAGGPVSGGRAYVVGERGPELMVPRSSGTVIPNSALNSSRGSSYAPVYHIDARGADQAAIARLENGLAQRDKAFGRMVDSRMDTRQARGTRG
jgi:phage-related minor tail protein